LAQGSETHHSMFAPLSFLVALGVMSAESFECYGYFGCVLKHDAPDLLHGRYDSKEACEKVCAKAPLLGAKKPLCNPKFACCTRGADFCRAKDAHAFCDPTVAGTARGFKGGCACPYGTTFSVKAQKCMGGKPPAPGPTPGGPYCVHDAPTNACGTCTTPEDCGGNKTDWSLCWANMDEKCPDSDAALVQQTDAETCMESGNLGCLQPSGACNYEKCTPCCAGLICYHDQDAGDMCMRPPPVADVEQSPQGCPAGSPPVSDANPFPCHASGCSQPYTCNEETGCCSETVLFA